MKRNDTNNQEKPEKAEKSGKIIDTNVFWLVGGLIGAVVGVRLSFNLICSFTLQNPDFCVSIIRICTILLIILIVFGAASGIVAGNIAFFLRDIFSKKQEGKKKNKKKL